MPTPDLPVILFGYTSSPFTQKVRLALKLKAIPYTYMTVPSMLPRPLIISKLNIGYRKIPILALGREIYCDTAIILEALEHFFSPEEGYGTLYPICADGRRYKSLSRGFASYWTDRPLFRVTTGLIPARVWRTRFGDDRAELIGHRLDADKLERKLPDNLARLDSQLSLLEGMFGEDEGRGLWVFSSQKPGLADVAVFYQLQWGREISAGRVVADLTGGAAEDSDDEGVGRIFNAERYPKVWKWFRRMELYFEDLPAVEERDPEVEGVLRRMREAPALGKRSLLLPTPRADLLELSEKTGLREGVEVSVAPDDTGKDE